MKVRAVCIDDQGRPNEIPISKWVKKGELYHITWIYNQHQQPGFKGVELAEFDISDCIPYNCYNLARFAIFEDDIDILTKMLKAGTYLDNADISNKIGDILNE